MIYPNYYQPNYNPYQQSNYMPQNAYNVPQPSIPSITGRTVTDFNEIVANDVPMDGRSAVFLKQDLSEIQIRSWGADGKIQMRSYKPILDRFGIDTVNDIPNYKNIEINLADDVKNAFMDRFDEITSRLDDIDKLFSKSRQPRVKKETDSDDK